MFRTSKTVGNHSGIRLNESHEYHTDEHGEGMKKKRYLKNRDS